MSAHNCNYKVILQDTVSSGFALIPKFIYKKRTLLVFDVSHMDII